MLASYLIVALSSLKIYLNWLSNLIEEGSTTESFSAATSWKFLFFVRVKDKPGSDSFRFRNDFATT